MINGPSILANVNTCAYWDELYQKEWERGQVAGASYKRNYEPIHDAIVQLIHDGCRVLDIASGPGLLCQKIKERRPSCTVMGVDFSRETITRCKKRDRDLGIEYPCLDVRHDLPSIRGKFDVVMMCEILEHLEEPAKIVADAMNLLKQGGLFVLTCPHDDGIPDREHIQKWGHDELFHLLDRYSQTISFTHFPPPSYHFWMLAHLTKCEGSEETTMRQEAT